MKEMTNIQRNYFVGALWRANKSDEFIEWELMLIDSNRKGELSDFSCMILTSPEYLEL